MIARTAVSRPRRGAALVEALLATLLGAVVIGAALDALVRTTRVGRELATRAAARAQLEQATAALSADLRTATTAAGGDDDPADVRAVADTAVEVIATLGAGVACAVGAAPGAGSTIDLAGQPAAPASPALAWWSAPPRPGDVAFVHDDAGTPSAADDRWSARTVRAVSDGASYCRSGPFAAAAAAGGAPDDAPRLRLTLDGPALPASVGAGAPVRIARRRRHALYRAPDGWTLGVREWDGTAWETTQPIAGPFASPANDGLRIEAVDAAGVSVQGSPPARPVAELRVLLRATCSARDPRLRCVDSALAVVRPVGGGA